MRTLRSILPCALIGMLFAVCGLRAAAETPESASPAGRLTREVLLQALSGDLRGHFNLEGDLQLELLRPLAPPAIVARKWAVQVLEYPIAASASMLVRCRVFADGAAVSETAFVLRAGIWRDVWASRQPLSVGATFDPAALEVRRVDLFRERDALPASAGDRSWIFARAVPAGRLLTWRDIARRPLVRKGELVAVSAVDGALRITLKALALENGAAGETITLRNPESRKDFSALVIDENRVQVRF